MKKELAEVIDREGLNVYTLPLPERIKGLYYSGNIALSDKLETTAERDCILAEEIGHHLTAVGDITGTSTDAIKQERKGRTWAFETLLPFPDLVEAMTHGCTTRYELAELFGVTEKFIDEAIDHYRAKYGTEARISGYAVQLVPYISAY